MNIRPLSLLAPAAVLLAVGVMLCLGAVWNAYAHKPGDTAGYLCVVGLPPEGVDRPLDEFNEGSRVKGRWTVWPMGRACTWHSVESERTLTYPSGGWGPTWLMLVGVTLASVGLGIALKPRRPSMDA